MNRWHHYHDIYKCCYAKYQIYMSLYVNRTKTQMLFWLVVHSPYRIPHVHQTIYCQSLLVTRTNSKPISNVTMEWFATLVIWLSTWYKYNLLVLTVSLPVTYHDPKFRSSLDHQSSWADDPHVSETHYWSTMELMQHWDTQLRWSLHKPGMKVIDIDYRYKITLPSEKTKDWGVNALIIKFNLTLNNWQSYLKSEIKQ